MFPLQTNRMVWARLTRKYLAGASKRQIELAKEILIEISQEQAYSPIYVKLKGSPVAAVQ